MVNKELLAPCGLYCGVCAILMAHRDNNQKFKEILAPVYGVTPEQITIIFPGQQCQGERHDRRGRHGRLELPSGEDDGDLHFGSTFCPQVKPELCGRGRDFHVPGHLNPLFATCGGLELGRIVCDSPQKANFRQSL